MNPFLAVFNQKVLYKTVVSRNSQQRTFGGTASPLWLRAVLFGTAYFVCAEVSRYLSVQRMTYVSFWLPSGLYLATLLLNPRRDWPWLILAALPANLAFDLIHGTRLAVILCFYVANTTQAVVGASLVKHFIAERPALGTLKEFIGLLGFAAVLSTMLGAVIGAWTLTAFGMSNSFAQSWAVWWGSTAMAILVLTPFILTWFSKPGGARALFDSPKRIVEAALLFLGLGVYLWYLLTQEQGTTPNKSPVIPLFLWAGLRFGQRGATLACVSVALTLAYFTTQSFAGLDPSVISAGGYVFDLQLLLATVSLVALVPAIVFAERDETTARLRNSEESLRATIQNTPNVAVQWFDREGRVVFWNRASESLYGWTEAEALGHRLDQLIFTPAQAAEFDQALLQINQTGEAIGPVEFPFHHRNGTRGIILSTVFRIQLPSGEPRFVCMDVDLTERKAAEKSLREAQERELRAREEFGHQLLDAQESERRRIASELHDSLGQNLSVIKNRAHLARQSAFAQPDTTAHLEAIERIISDAITETRSLAHNLRPPHIDEIGLTDCLNGLIQEVSQSSDIRFERRLENVDDIFKDEKATNVYRIVQEALNNLVKHSHATKAVVTLQRDVRTVQLRVADDGVGFDIQKMTSRRGLGLTSITERARMLGGKLEVESAPRKGTQLTVELPFSDGEV